MMNYNCRNFLYLNNHYRNHILKDGDIVKELIIWSSYIDCNKSRAEGRKVSKDLCINKPKLKDIYNALKKMGYEVEIVKNKCYPREWWENT